MVEARHRCAMWRTAMVAVAMLGGCGARSIAVEPVRYRCDDVDLSSLAQARLAVAPPGEVIAVVSTRETPWGRFDDHGRPPSIGTAAAADEYVISTDRGLVDAHDRGRSVTRVDNRFGLDAPMHLVAVRLVDDPAWALPQIESLRVLDAPGLSRSMTDAQRRWDGAQMTIVPAAKARVAELEFAMPRLLLTNGRSAAGFTATWDPSQQRLSVRWRWSRTSRGTDAIESAAVATATTLISTLPPSPDPTTVVELKLGFGLDLQYDGRGRLLESRWLVARPGVHTTNFSEAVDTWLPRGIPRCTPE